MLSRAARSFLRELAAAVYPNRCPSCGKIIGRREYWCERCFELLPRVKRDPEPPRGVSRLYACCIYRHRARAAVHCLKFGRYIDAAESMAVLIYDKISGELGEADVLVPVPSSLVNLKWRRFSSAHLIAGGISARSGRPVEALLRARKDKREQRILSEGVRLENAKKGFYIPEGANIAGKRIMLIDDVCATGSTLSAAAELLREAGAREIRAAVFAKTPYSDSKKRDNGAR